ncbi:hypothetical protein WJX72_005719 [[Myrmecia] bisecta]|uniref:Early light-induced protein n=1 Tax=[Myrmecia] bisecta TaxID=41462 RepID=A0AAW1R6W9_9CHLO
MASAMLTSTTFAPLATRTAVPSRSRFTSARPGVRQPFVLRAVDSNKTQTTERAPGIENVEAGNVSNENAERRADIQGKPTFTEAQAFDGPVPETINGRLAMLGVTAALAAEFFGTHDGIKQQIAAEPVGVLAAFVIISLASYIPVFRGYTRKEPFENGIFTAKAENWNGRLAMVGFAGILITEALSGKTIPEFYGFF